MLKSCKYCGRIHAKNFDCGKKPKRIKSVHHITQLEQDFELRLENDNLITLCGSCHEEAETGMISKECLRSLII